MATAEGKVTTARITEGTLVLVTYYKATQYSEAGYGPSQTKVKNAERLTVTKVEAAKVGRVTGRAITGVLDDGDTVTVICGPSQTFWLAQPPKRAAKRDPKLAPVGFKSTTAAEVRKTNRTKSAQAVAARTAETLAGKLPTPAKGEKVIGAKALRLTAVAESLGWSARSYVSGSEARFAATRGEETIKLMWHDEVVKAKGLHEFPGGTKTIYNAKEATRAMEQATPVVSVRQAPRRTQAASNGQPSERVTAVVRSLPFDPATASDAEVLAHVQPTATVSWVNSVSGLTETAQVYCRRNGDKLDPSKPLRSLKVHNGQAGRRIVTFPSEDGGLRSVALEHLVSVR